VETPWSGLLNTPHVYRNVSETIDLELEQANAATTLNDKDSSENHRAAINLLNRLQRDLLEKTTIIDHNSERRRAREEGDPDQKWTRHTQLQNQAKSSSSHNKKRRTTEEGGPGRKRTRQTQLQDQAEPSNTVTRALKVEDPCVNDPTRTEMSDIHHKQSADQLDEGQQNHAIHTIVIVKCPLPQ
jgi:hypothetical protein